MQRALGTLAGALAVLTLTGFDFGGVKGDGNIQQQTRQVGEFKAVGVSHGIHAKVTLGSPASAKLKGDANLLALVTLEVKDGALQTVVKDNQGLRPTRPIELEVTTPTLEAVAASGGAEVLATASPSGKFDVASSGGAVVKVSSLRSDEVDVAASGGAEITLAGEAKRLDISTSGGSKVKARSLVSADATVEGSGGAEIHVHARERITGSLSGGAEVTVQGNPSKRKIVTSGGAEAHFES